MERITAEELRRIASDIDLYSAHDYWIERASDFRRAADTIDDMDKDIAILESNRDHLMSILNESVED